MWSASRLVTSPSSVCPGSKVSIRPVCLCCFSLNYVFLFSLQSLFLCICLTLCGFRAFFLFFRENDFFFFIWAGGFALHQRISAFVLPVVTFLRCCLRSFWILLSSPFFLSRYENSSANLVLNNKPSAAKYVRPLVPSLSHCSSRWSPSFFLALLLPLSAASTTSNGLSSPLLTPFFGLTFRPLAYLSVLLYVPSSFSFRRFFPSREFSSYGVVITLLFLQDAFYLASVRPFSPRIFAFCSIYAFTLIPHFFLFRPRLELRRNNGW